MIYLQNLQPFASGGNRLCFIHPNDSNRCIKVFRPDRTPKLRRKEKGLLGQLRPLSKFDENFTEAQMLDYLQVNYPEEIRKHIPQTYGIEQTDCGPGHTSTVFRDSDGLISLTLEQYIYKNGLDEPIQNAINQFLKDWAVMTPPTRDLIPHNIVAQNTSAKISLFLIDGLGRRPRLPPFPPFPLSILKKSLMHRRQTGFNQRIDKILKRKVSLDLPNQRLENLKREL